MSLGFIKFFPVYADGGLAQALKVFIAFVQEMGRGLGGIKITPVPIAEQGLKGQLVLPLALHDHPVQTGYLILRQMIEYTVV